MPRISLPGLFDATTGDQSKKVTVTKPWLRAVCAELTRLYAIEDAQAAKAKFDLSDDLIRGVFGGKR